MVVKASFAVHKTHFRMRSNVIRPGMRLEKHVDRHGAEKTGLVRMRESAGLLLTRKAQTSEIILIDFINTLLKRKWLHMSQSILIKIKHVPAHAAYPRPW